MRRTTFSNSDVVMEMPDISGITTDIELLLKCVNIWRMNGFSGVPPDPYEVALMSRSQQEVIIMTNFVDFIRDESKRAAMLSGSFRFGDM